jgi:hypothetical protein
VNLSLRTKLFLTLLCVSLVTILVAHGLMRWSIVQGLERLVAEREAQRLDAIADRLAALHRIDGGWDGLRVRSRALAAGADRLDRGVCARPAEVSAAGGTRPSSRSARR